MCNEEVDEVNEFPGWFRDALAKICYRATIGCSDDAASLCESIRERTEDELGHASPELGAVLWIASHIYMCQQHPCRSLQALTAAQTVFDSIFGNKDPSAVQELSSLIGTEISRAQRVVERQILAKSPEQIKFDDGQLHKLCHSCVIALRHLEQSVLAEKFSRLYAFLHDEKADAARCVAQFLHPQGKHEEALHHLYAARGFLKSKLDFYKEKRGYEYEAFGDISKSLSAIEQDISKLEQHGNTSANDICNQCNCAGSGRYHIESCSTTSAKKLSYYNAEAVYKNHAVPKGFALIINNYEFKPKPRLGTDEDEREMHLMLKNFGYAVESYRDLSAKQMLERAEKFAAYDHRRSHSCVVVVLTHGRLNTLLGTDGSLVDIVKFMRYFERAPSLVGKPKIFIFQACRGGRREYGVPHEVTDGSESFLSWLWNVLPTRAVSINQQTKFIEKIPETADVLVAYSSSTEYISLRNKRTGSWFIQTICNVFSTHAAGEDILGLLTRVNREVATKQSRKGEKQMPSFVSQLRKKFYFMPGVNSE